MAKINVEFDTVEKTMSVSMDGKSVNDISEVFFIKSWNNDDEWTCSLGTMQENEGDDLKVYTRLIASDKGLIEIPKVHAEIAEFLS